MLLIISSLLFITATLLSPWITRLPLIAIVFVIFLTFVLHYYKKFKSNNFSRLVIFISFLQLLLYQILTTRINSTYEFSGNDRFVHQQQLDSYPPYLYRIANIIENKLDSPIIIRLRQNLFDSLDLVDYFKNYFLSILFIPFIVGLIKFIQHPDRIFISLFSISIIIFTIIGTKGLYGPILFLPFIINIICIYPFEK